MTDLFWPSVAVAIAAMCVATVLTTAYAPKTPQAICMEGRGKWVSGGTFAPAGFNGSCEFPSPSGASK